MSLFRSFSKLNRDKRGRWFFQTFAFWFLSACALSIHLYFNVVDPYVTFFDELNYWTFVYNPMRGAFICFFLYFMHSCGSSIIRTAMNEKDEKIVLGYSGFALPFFLGCALWQIFIWFIGILGVMSPGIVLGSVIISLIFICSAGHEINIRPNFTLPTSVPISNPVAISAVAVVLLFALILLNQALNIASFDYDSAGHYAPYYLEVAENRSTDFNNHWYHFWVSKGASLFFFATILTDVNGAQLVSYAMLVAAFFALNDIAKNSGWGDFDKRALLILFFSVPFIDDFSFFQKHHIVNFSMICGFLLTSLLLINLSLRNQNIARYQIMATLIMTACVLTNSVLSAFILPLAAYLCLVQIFAGRQPLFVVATPLFVGICVLAIFSFNFMETGLIEVTPYRFFQQFADFDKLKQVVSPYILLIMDEGSKNTTGSFVDPSMQGVQLFETIKLLLRTEVFFPLFPQFLLGVVLAAFLATITGKIDRERKHGFYFALVFIAIALFLGLLASQPGSLARFYTFNVAVLAVLIAASVGVILNLMPVNKLKANKVAPGIIWLIGMALVFQFSFLRLDNISMKQTNEYINNKISFLSSTQSFEEAFLNTHYPPTTHYPPKTALWPRRMVDSYCLSAAKAAQQTYLFEEGDQKTRPSIWSLTFIQESGCHMLPMAEFRLEVTHRFGTAYHKLVFSPVEITIQELRKIGVELFYINTRPFDMSVGTISTRIWGCMAYSELFQRQNIEKYFQILWQKDGRTLLRLVPEKSRQTDNAIFDFAEAYSKKKNQKPRSADWKAICERVGNYYLKNGEDYPIKTDPSLPKLVGWQ